jgi:hypothetical protein
VSRRSVAGDGESLSRPSVRDVQEGYPPRSCNHEPRQRAGEFNSGGRVVYLPPASKDREAFEEDAIRKAHYRRNSALTSSSAFTLGSGGRNRQISGGMTWTYPVASSPHRVASTEISSGSLLTLRTSSTSRCSSDFQATHWSASSAIVQSKPTSFSARRWRGPGKCSERPGRMFACSTWSSVGREDSTEPADFWILEIRLPAEGEEIADRQRGRAARRGAVYGSRVAIKA